jgi:hypothetical protein
MYASENRRVTFRLSLSNEYMALDAKAIFS